MKQNSNLLAHKRTIVSFVCDEMHFEFLERMDYNNYIEWEFLGDDGDSRIYVRYTPDCNFFIIDAVNFEGDDFDAKVNEKDTTNQVDAMLSDLYEFI